MDSDKPPTPMIDASCDHITTLETTSIDGLSKGVRTFACRCGRRGEQILTIEPKLPAATGRPVGSARSGSSRLFTAGEVEELLEVALRGAMRALLVAIGERS